MLFSVNAETDGRQDPVVQHTLTRRIRESRSHAGGPSFCTRGIGHAHRHLSHHREEERERSWRAAGTCSERSTLLLLSRREENVNQDRGKIGDFLYRRAQPDILATSTTLASSCHPTQTLVCTKQEPERKTRCDPNGCAELPPHCTLRSTVRISPVPNHKRVASSSQAKTALKMASRNAECAATAMCVSERASRKAAKLPARSPRS